MTRLRAIPILALLVGLSAGFASCQRPADAPSPSSAGFPSTAIDASGVAVTLPSRPERIISGTLMTDEILLSLVAPERIAALSSFATDPAVSNVADRTGPVDRFLPLNVEAYIALDPDLVFLAPWSDASSVALLRDAGIPVFLIASPVDLDGVVATVRKLAEYLREVESGEAMVAWIEGRREAIRDAVSGLPAGERTVLLDYNTWGTSMGSGSSWDSIVREAACVNAAGELAADAYGQVPMSREIILTLDPDLLVLPSWLFDDPGGSDRFLASVLSDPVLATLRAVRENRVFRIPEAHRSSTSQYMVLAVEDVVRAAYPGLLP